MAAAKKQTAVRHLPVKRSINLAAFGQKPIDPRLAVPAVVLILVLAFLFSRYAVIGRLTKLSRTQSEVSALRTDVEELYAQIEALEDVPDTYAHYTRSGMTNEELDLADRAEVMELLETAVFPYVSVAGWTLTDNVLTLPITGSDLQEINQIAQLLRQEDIVDFCVVTTAATDSGREITRTITEAADPDDTEGGEGDEGTEQTVTVSSYAVTGQITVYLNGAMGGADE